MNCVKKEIKTKKELDISHSSILVPKHKVYEYSISTGETQPNPKNPQNLQLYWCDPINIPPTPITNKCELIDVLERLSEPSISSRSIMGNPSISSFKDELSNLGLNLPSDISSDGSENIDSQILFENTRCKS